jgi:RNA polymerase-binding transcription factor DksA
MRRPEVVEILDLRTEVDPATWRRLRAALARIDRGTFGLCTDCARPIERARIDAMPLIELCAGCEEAQLGAQAATV